MLIVDHPLRTTDVVFVLAGDVTLKADHAARIYAAIQPHTILISPGKNAELTLRRLNNLHGIPSAKTQILPGGGNVTSTWEEAIVFREYLKTTSIRSVTIVTNSFHTGRTYWTFRRTLPKEMEIRISAAPEETFSRQNWWQTESGLVTALNETVKWVFYWWNY